MPDLTEVEHNKLNLELRKSRKKSLTVTDSRIHGFLVGARQLVRQDGGRAAHFTVRNRCNLPRRAHQLASAYKNPEKRHRLFLCGNRR